MRDGPPGERLLSTVNDGGEVKCRVMSVAVTELSSYCVCYLFLSRSLSFLARKQSLMSILLPVLTYFTMFDLILLPRYCMMLMVVLGVALKNN